MSPEYGATCAIFPVDEVTLQYLRFTGRSEERVALVEAYMKEQGLFHSSSSPEPAFTDTLSLDLATVEPSIAGPRRPQDRVRLSDAGRSFRDALSSLLPTATARPGKEAAKGTSEGPAAIGVWGEGSTESPAAHAVMQEEATEVLEHGSVVIAAITSCTNTSNPSVMLAAGLLAKKAVERGLERKPWVKTSLAPGSKVVMDYYERAGLTPYLQRLGFDLVGYGCTTCIGNSGPLPMEISDAIQRRGLVACSVLSGNRNFEGRINSDVRANYLMSPPLVVAFALAGRIDIDLFNEPLGQDPRGVAVYLRDIWPSSEEVERTLAKSIQSEMYRKSYGAVFVGDERWNGLEVPQGDRFEWAPKSTYVRRPPYFDGMSKQQPEKVSEIRGARVIAVLGDSVTTDHISPAGSIKKDSPAGRYLISQGVSLADFNSYGSRRGNHEVLVRGTFANTRIRNRLAPNTEGGVTTYLPTGEVMSIYDAAMRYLASGTPLLVLAGKEYGSGSSRDWAAKGPALQGIRAVIAESYERIHRSNLVGMGILPLQFAPGASATTLGLTGREVFDLEGLVQAIDSAFAQGRNLRVRAQRDDGTSIDFIATIRIDTPQELLYYQHGGILQYVLRQLLWGRQKARAIGGGLATAPEPPARPSNARKIEEGSRESFPASDPPAY
jgi:aconitate hydratase